jgi:serine/threonine protein phosphatase PrpC
MPLTHFSALGGRAEQQDRYVTSEIPGAGQLMAVMDGHGGPQTAEQVARELTPLFTDALTRRRDPILALRETVQKLADSTAHHTAGSSLSIVYIPANAQRAYVAILGDSPVLIKGHKGVLHISPIHNARSSEHEREAALSRGARYTDGYLEDPQEPGPGLQLSRALGDRVLSRVLSREPEVYSVPLDLHSRVILATDGVLDSFETGMEAQLRDLMNQTDAGKDAQALVEAAVQRGTGDNVTVIVWTAIGVR